MERYTGEISDRIDRIKHNQIDFEDLKEFILSKRPSLKGKDYRIVV